MPRLLVIGVGSIGERHVRCFQSTGQVTVSICEPNAAVRQQIAERYGIKEAFADFDSALASRPEMAVICTPAHLHIAQAQRLAEAGVQLLIEKPLSTNLTGIDQLLKTLEEQKTIAAVAYVYRAFPVLTEMRRELLSGRFGTPVEAIYIGGQHFPTYRPAYREIYYTRHETGGGAVQDALTHMVNLTEWLVGPITDLAADADHKILEGVTVEDTVHVVARHGSLMASYALNQHQAPNEGTVTINCTKGTVRFEVHENRWRWQTDSRGHWHNHPQPAMERDTVYIAQAEAFLAAVAGKAPVLCSVPEALNTLKANLAILNAVKTQAWQQV